MSKVGRAVGGVAKTVASPFVGGVAGSTLGAATGILGGAGGGAGQSGGGGRPVFTQKFTSENLAADIKKGQELLGKDFAEGNLGRLEEAPSADITSIVEARRQGLKGLSSEENQALRERASQGIDRGTQTALRQLRGIQGASGVRGATASAQAGRQLSAGQAAKAQTERDLLIRNVEERQKGLEAFESTVTGTEEAKQQRELFNIQQRKSEIAGRQTAGLGFAQLGVTERTGASAANVAAASAAGGGGKK